MPNPVDEYVRANDNAGDYANRQIELLNQEALEEIDDLFTGVEGRDPEFWTEFVDPELVLDDYEQVDPAERDLDWVEGLAGISAAATTQFFLDNSEKTIVKPLAYREQVLDPFELTQAQLVQAGKRQFEAEAIETFAKLNAKYLDEVSFLREMEPKALYQALGEYGAIPPMEKQVADAAGYVARMTDYRPGSVQFKEQVSALIKRDAGDQMRQMNRRAVQRIYSYREAGGDPKSLLVWVLESSKPCPYCIENAGDVDTYENWILRGQPGAEVCAGRDRCHCHLAAAT
jgi:hypothetical protein